MLHISLLFLASLMSLLVYHTATWHVGKLTVMTRMWQEAVLSPWDLFDVLHYAHRFAHKCDFKKVAIGEWPSRTLKAISLSHYHFLLVAWSVVSCTISKILPLLQCMWLRRFTFRSFSVSAIYSWSYKPPLHSDSCVNVLQLMYALSRIISIYRKVWNGNCTDLQAHSVSLVFVPFDRQEDKVIPSEECVPKHKLLVMDMQFSTRKRRDNKFELSVCVCMEAQGGKNVSNTKAWSKIR